jgi:ketosteroid isomerase-like protein
VNEVTKTLKDEIVALSDEWSRAIVANDADAIGSFCADTWILVSEHGVLTKDTFLTLVRSGQLTHESMETQEIAAFNEYGQTVVLAARVESVAIFEGQRFESNEWTSDVFIQSEEGWKCIVTHVTPVDTK